MEGKGGRGGWKGRVEGEGYPCLSCLMESGTTELWRETAPGISQP